MTFITLDLVDDAAVVEARDEILSVRPHQGVLDGTEQDTVQLLNVMLLQLLKQRENRIPNS